MLSRSPVVSDPQLERLDLEPFPQQVPPSAMYRRLRACGLTDTQAGDLTARAAGLTRGGRPWRLAEVQRLQFLRALVEQGRISS